MTKNDNESNGTANSSSVDASDSAEDDVAVTPPQDPGEPDPESMRQDLPKTKEDVPDISCAAPVVVVESDTKPLQLGCDGGKKVETSTMTTLLESPRVKLEPWDETEPVIHVTERTTVPKSSIENISVDDFSTTNHDTNASLQMGEQQAAEGTAEMEESEQSEEQVKVKAVQVENGREELDAKAMVELQSKIVEGEEQHQMESRPNADPEEFQGAEQQRPETDATGTEQALQENDCREECLRQEAKADEEGCRREADAKAQDEEAERMRNHTDALEITEKEQLKQGADAKEVVAIDELIDVRSIESVDVEEAKPVQVATESTVMRGIVDSPSDELGSPIMMDRALSKSNSNILIQANAQTTVSELADESTLLQETIAVVNPALPQTVVGEEKKEKAQSNGSTNAFKQTCSSTYIKPPPIQTTRQAESSTKQTPRGLTFAQAFGSKPASIVSPLATPRSAENKESSAVPVDPPTSTKSVGSSHSALSASKNKKVQVLMSKYMEGAAHQALPGDSIPLRKIDAEASPACSTSFASQDTPLSAQSIQEKIAVTEIELAKLPKISSVLEKFESSSKSAGSNTVFEFGEHFRQKQRFDLLSEKEKAKEAKVALHGFNERDLFPGKVAAGEIDTSSLGKVYTFEMSTNMSRDLPVDGICRVNYKIADYTAMVFVVHRTRGMLLLHIGSGANQKRQVPSGVVLEREFLEAAQKSGSANVQLQIAAREAAGRQLFDNTGLDIRNQVDRFKPAILRLNPPVDAKGVQYLKNEYNNRLYYFLQVDEDDFTSIAHTCSSDKLSRPSEDPGDTALTLRLRDDFDGFAFVLDPSDAAKILKEDGDLEATSALYMIMNEASESISKNSPDAKATEYSVVDSAPDDEKADWLESTGNIRTVGEKDQGLGKLQSGNGMTSFHDEADLKIKTSLDTNEHTDGVACCCGWW